MAEDRGLHLRGLHQQPAEAGSAGRLEQLAAYAGQHLPIVVRLRSQRVQVAIGNAALQVRFDVLQVLGLAGVDVARQVEVEVVRLDLRHRHHARVTRLLQLAQEGVDDAVHVLRAQPVLVAVLDEAPAGVDHEDAFAARTSRLVQHHDAGRNAGAVEQVGRQTHQRQDHALLHQLLADGAFSAAAEQHAVRQDHRAAAGALQARQDVQQEGVVAVLRRRHAVGKAFVQVVARVQPAGPVLLAEGRVGHHVIEGLQPQRIALVLEVRAAQRVGGPDLGGGAVMQHHVHARQRRRGVVHLLPVNGQVMAGAALGQVVRLQQQRARPAGGVVDGLRGRRGLVQPDHLRHHARHLGGRVELALALARLGGEVPHQVFVGVAQQIVAFGAVAAEVQALEDGHQPGEAVHHLLALAELFFVVEVGDVDGALQAVVA